MPLRIPHTELPTDTLDALIEEFVTRDGTNLSQAQNSAEKIRKMLDSGRAVIVFDEASESCNILLKEEADRAGL